MRKTMVAAAMAAAVLGGTGVATAPAASAASCPSGATCAYTGTNFTGSQGPVYGNNTDDAQYSTWANAESISNNGTQCTDWIYYGKNYGNPNFSLAVGYVVSNLSGSWGWHHLYSNHWCSPA